MSRDELLDELIELSKSHRNPEKNHLQADQALLDYINDEEITKAFESIEKWYA